MAATQKAIRLRDAMKDKLAKRAGTSALAFVESFDANGDATLRVGSGVFSEAGAFIRIKSEASLQVDGVGNTQRVYTPGIVQVAFEADPAGGAGANINTYDIVLAVLGDATGTGCKTEVWLETNGTAPTATTFDTANKKKGTYEPTLEWPLMSTM